MDGKPRRSDVIIAAAGFVLLLFFHHDFWRDLRPDIFFGWLPAELAYRGTWMLGAWAYLWFFTKRIWRSCES